MLRALPLLSRICASASSRVIVGLKGSKVLSAGFRIAIGVRSGWVLSGMRVVVLIVWNVGSIVVAMFSVRLTVVFSESSVSSEEL